MRAPFPSSRLEVLTPDDQTWACFGIYISYHFQVGGETVPGKVFVEPSPPEGSKVVHVDTRIVDGAIVETIDVICEV